MERLHNVFVYGTLLDKGVRISKTGNSFDEAIKAVLIGYEKVGLNIIENENELVCGLVLQVTDEELKSLDRYESIDYGLYYKIKVEVITPKGKMNCIAYKLTNSNSNVIAY